MSEFKRFWLIWSPQGVTPPSRRHDTPDSAQKEAERLAREAPGKEFYVLAAVGCAKKIDVEWSKASDEAFEEPDGIPF